jgi:hypothetical protein
MADYGTINEQYNSGAGTDASPVWTGTAIALGGSSGANEMRMALTGGAQTTTTPSASWPTMARTGGPVTQLWAFTADTTGLQLTTYTGDNTKANVLRWSFDSAGNPVTAMQITFYANATHTNPSAGTQPPGTNNDAFTNGHATDTSSTSYIKGNCYGSGLTAAGTQETPSAGSVGTMPTATTGSGGAATPSAGSWLTTWQHLQGTIGYLQGPAIPKTLTAFFWYHTLIIFLGANFTPGTYTIVEDVTYSYS